MGDEYGPCTPNGAGARAGLGECPAPRGVSADREARRAGVRPPRHVLRILPWLQGRGRFVLALLWLALAACGGGPAPSSWVDAPGGVREPLEEGAFLPLRTRGERLVDASGRQVLLRGLQHHALQDVRYVGREVEPGDYARIASWGFTTLRMAISWSRVEPERGVRDEAYVEEIRAALELAHAAGLGVILEWHQDLWGKCSQPAESGLSLNANGAPDWTCPPGFTLDFFAYNRLFDRFWANEDGLFDAFLDAWAFVVERVGEHPALVGYDLLNEPLGSGSSPGFERDILFPAYRRAVPALRARGMQGLLFLDAPGTRNERLSLAAEPLGELGPDVVYAPHLYSGWITQYMFATSVPREDKRRDFENALEEARTMGLPLWNGEWGVNLKLPSALMDLEFHLRLEDEARIGSSYWAFNRVVPGQGDDSLSGGQSLLDEQRQPRAEVLDRLSRPYPLQTPGQLTALSYDFGQRHLELTAEIDAHLDAPLVLYAPRRHLGERACLEVSGPGAWRWDEHPARERISIRFGVSGTWRVALAPCPTSAHSGR